MRMAGRRAKRSATAACTGTCGGSIHQAPRLSKHCAPINNSKEIPMPTSLMQKLQIKSGKLIVINAPQGYAEQLAKALKDLTVSTRAVGQAEAVLLFVNSLAEVDKFTPKASKLVKP